MSPSGVTPALQQSLPFPTVGCKEGKERQEGIGKGLGAGSHRTGPEHVHASRRHAATFLKARRETLELEIGDLR
jgi:hypothetical protein